jgi:POT family proton-dependent oligopeptide transporter
MAHRTTPDPELKGYPPGIPYIIGNEGCERFSYYGMRAILYVYVVSLFINLRGLDKEVAANEATATTHLFFAAVYAFPLIGALIADRLLGKYRTILWLSVVYCLGHAALALFEGPGPQIALFGQVIIDPINGLYVGLGLIAIGSGGIKPCVSAHVGDQFGRGNWHLLRNVYNAFYFIINFGSAFSTLIIPQMLGKEIIVDGQVTFEGSAAWAFAVPGILMGLATIAFWMGRKVFVHVPPTQPLKLGLLDVLSGTFLFMVIGWPIFFGDSTHVWFGLGGPVEVVAGLSMWAEPVWLGLGASAAVNTLVALGCFVAFVLVFGFRQRLKPDTGFLALTFFAVKARIFKEDHGPGEAPTKAHIDDLRGHWLYGAVARRHGNAVAEGPIAVWKIMSIFLFVSVFWALFDQHSSTWIEQAKHMDRTIDVGLTGYLIGAALLGLLVAYCFHLSGLTKWGLVAGLGCVGLGFLAEHYGPYTLKPSQIGALNPFMVMILIPLTNFGLYPLLDRIGLKAHPLRRMTLGMLLTGLSFVAVALIQRFMDGAPDGALHVGWQLIPYLIITTAEVMVSITGLEFAYSQAPKSMKSVIMGLWLFNVTLGNLLVAFIARLPEMGAEKFFWVFAGLMFIAAALFGLRAKFYRYKEFTQDA